MAINFNYNFPQVARDAGFKLRQFKDGPLDWRLMGSLEIERILRDQSIEQIDGVLAHLSEAPLGSMLETNILDSGIAKYFVLSQFSIQYLLFCRKFLDETVRELRESHAESQMEVARLKQSLAEANNEILSLHKKMTQMEAIHEVVYPCHLCTKNFVSNEALNIHIGRKHHQATATKERRIETPVSVQKERDHDLNLINTIKLELEIKQLKERLNTAEKDIRERSSVANSKRATPREGEEVKAAPTSTRNVGIQSNLIEAKEKDDQTDENDCIERKEQLAILQEKISDFENWRETQAVNNEESITEINRKLADITQALNRSKNLKEQEAMEKETEMQRGVSQSVENLEQLLSEKVAAIGKASAEKLEEVVEKLESNYFEKLGELEREIKRKNVPEIKVVRSDFKEQRATEPQDIEERDKEFTRIKRNVPITSKERSTIVKAVKVKTNNDTYEIEDLNGTGLDEEELIKEQRPIKTMEREIAKVDREGDMATESIGSNHTFVKSIESKEQVKGLPKPQFISDSTDISESFSEEETHSDNDDDSTETEAELVQRPKTAKRYRVERENIEKRATKVDAEEQKSEKRDKKVSKPKLFTRGDARKLTNRRLSSLGMDMKAKSVSNASMKRVSAELAEQRNALKQKYPHFYATRNKIKKFVNKLCSAKLPDNAEALLKRTQPLQPMEVPKARVAQLQYDAAQTPEQTEDDDNSSFEAVEATASTPLQTSIKESSSGDAFKQRLERLLASPMREPGMIRAQEQTTATTVQVHPVPQPRKRVMFNTRRPEDNSDVDNFK